MARWRTASLVALVLAVSPAVSHAEPPPEPPAIEGRLELTLPRRLPGVWRPGAPDGLFLRLSRWWLAPTELTVTGAAPVVSLGRDIEYSHTLDLSSIAPGLRLESYYGARDGFTTDTECALVSSCSRQRAYTGLRFYPSAHQTHVLWENAARGSIFRLGLGSMW